MKKLNHNAFYTINFYNLSHGVIGFYVRDLKPQQGLHYRSLPKHPYQETIE